jgi:hypothetical protein
MGSGRISVAGLFCVRPHHNPGHSPSNDSGNDSGDGPGSRPRWLYRIKIHRRARKGKAARRSFAETDYAALLDAAHRTLGTDIVLIWDNLNTHLSATMRTLITRRPWLHIIQLPAYAPDLNPTEGVWSHVKHSLGNLAVTNVDHLATLVRKRLKRIQNRPTLLTGILAHTGLTLDPPP